MKSNENFYKRLSELSGIKKENTSKSKVNESAELVEFIRTKDKTAYGVIREGHNYYIKKSTKLSEDLSAPDFSHINGIANSSDYKYDTLNRAQKNVKLFVEGINEAFDLGVTRKPQKAKTPSLNIGDDINSFISNRLSESRNELKYKNQERFKSSLKEQKENIEKIKKGALPEQADLAIKRALGKLNEEDLSTKDSKVVDADSVNKDGQSKEDPQAPINDKNAKTEADKNTLNGSMDKKPAQPKNLSVDESGQALSTMDSEMDKDKLNYPKGEFGDGKIKGAKELDNLILADSEIDADGSLANQSGSTKEAPQASVNDSNAKALADKAVTEGKEDEPYKEKTKNGGMATEDSDQTDGDRVDNKSKKEKVDSYDSHNKPEMAHKEKKGTPLKDTPSKKDVVAEGQEYDEVMAKFEKGELKDAHGNIVTDAGRAEAIANAKGEPSDMEEAEGEDDIQAAADALDDLESADVSDDSDEEVAEPEMETEPEMEVEPEAEPTKEPAPEEGGEEDIDIDIDGIDLDGGEGDAEADEEQPEGEDEPEEEEGGEPESDSGIDNDELMKKEIEKMVGKLSHKVRNISLEPSQAKSFMNSLISAFKKDLADIEVIDRKEMADEILKLDASAQDGDEVDVDGGEAEEVEENLEVYEEQGMEDGQEMTFEQYAESRGYSKDELHECGSDEMGNLMSGYIDEMDDQLSEAACEEMGSYINDEVMNELSEYGHDEHIDKLEPFKKAVKEGGVSHGMHEPMVDPSMQEDEDFDEVEIEDEVEQSAGFAAPAENMGLGGSKTKSVSIDLNSDKVDVNISEAEQKLKNYTVKKLKELAEGKKITINESKKSEKMKKLDRLIESEYRKMTRKLTESKKKYN